MNDAVPVLQTLGPVVPPILALGLGLWLARSSKVDRRHRFVLLPLAAVALIAPLWAILLTAPEPFDEAWRRLAGERYERLWAELDTASLEGATALESLELETLGSLDAFRALDTLAERSSASLLLIDPAGRVAAWAGEGLVHSLAPTSLPSTGPAHVSGFTSVTIASVRRVARQPTPWRLVAGRSFSTQSLPFGSPSGGSRHDFTWTVIRERSRPPAGGTIIEVDGRPSLSVALAPEAPAASRPRAFFLLQVAWIALGIALLLASRRLGKESQGPSIRPWAVITGTTSIAIGFASSSISVVLLLSVLVVVGVSLRRVGILAESPWWPFLPAGAVGILTLLAYRLEKIRGPVDLGGGLIDAPEVAVFRLTALLVILTGLLPVLLRAETDGGRGSARWTLGLLCLLAALTLAGGSAWALLPVGLGAILLAGALRTRGAVRRTLDVVLVIAVAALVGASTWQVAYQALVVRYVDRDVVPVLGPPSGDESRQLHATVHRFFSDVDIEGLVPADPISVDASDLAFALWRRSPLAHRGWLSAVAVVVEDSAVSFFEYGVPLAADGRVDESPELWQALNVPGWDESLIHGESDLTYLGETVGVIRYALLPRPGFRLIEGPPDRLASRLIGGGLATRLPIDEVVGRNRFAVYEDRPRPSFGPPDAPALPPETLRQRFIRLNADGETLRLWTHPTGETFEVVALPTPGPLKTLESMSVQLFGTLWLAALAALLVWLSGSLSLRAPAEGLRRVYRSYSKKLLVVYGSLLLLPLLALSIASLGVLGERLGRSQELAADSAMEAAQHVLGEYVLSLDPGFGVDTALDDALLGWLSRVIQHEVNLYWGSALYASSNPSLFTAGLLPARIPGKVYSELALEAGSRVSRPTQANRERYVELYAPLRIPGIRSQEALFLSIPLLAQQQETDRSIAELRTRAILVALLLLLALVAVASRLSRSFTRPLMELVAGTEAIAAGASSVDLEPTELELAALVNAINDMGAKIAGARERVLREKQVVEKMVQNITAGIVSLDAERRVLLRNRVAAEILGVEVGEPVEEALQRLSRLRPLVAFLAEAGDRPRQATLVIRPRQGEELEWSVVWVPMPGEGEPTSLLVVEDVSEVLRGQRLEAWAEMARMIAHEIKNPLTPIRLSTEHMLEVHESNPEAFEEVFERCSRNILSQVDELHEIASEFSTYSRMQPVQTQDEDLVEAVLEVVDSYRAAPPQGVRLDYEGPTAPCRLPLDRRLFGRALRNLIENALRVSVDGGEIEIGLGQEGDEAVVTVSDRGPGVDEETLARMFDPYFSANSGGTGLGLPISRRIVEMHGGSLSAANREGGGLTATIRLPRR